MLWVYKSLFFLQMNQNSFNFYFLNYFNYYLILKFNSNFKINKLTFNKKIESHNIKNLFKQNLMLKYFKYFNTVVLLNNGLKRLKQLNFYYSHNKNNFFYFNSYNFFYFKKLINLIFQINKENYNFVIFDKSYKNILPLYNYIYNFKNLSLYRKYFFVSTSFFTYQNWHYHYSQFIKKFNIILILIFDFQHFNKFFKILKNINLPISSLLPINNLNSFVDYPIYTNYICNFEKIIFYNLIAQTVLISFNYKNYEFKLKYLKLFYNFSLKFNF